MPTGGNLQNPGIQVVNPNVIAGSYSVFANATVSSDGATASGGNLIGDTVDGVRLRPIVTGREVNGDWYGQTVIGTIHEGMNLFIQFTALEWNNLTANMVWPTNPLLTDTFLQDNRHGLFDEDLAYPLVLVPRVSQGQSGTQGPTGLGSRAYQQQPKNLIFPLCFPAPNQNPEVLFGNSAPRTVPVMFRVFPYNPSGQGTTLIKFGWWA